VKHSDFLKSLKVLKSHLSKKKPSPFFRHYNTKDENICICKDSNGEFKYLYKSKDELEYVLSSKSMTIKSFSCPYEKGWHLTKV